MPWCPNGLPGSTSGKPLSYCLGILYAGIRTSYRSAGSVGVSYVLVLWSAVCQDQHQGTSSNGSLTRMSMCICISSSIRMDIRISICIPVCISNSSNYNNTYTHAHTDLAAPVGAIRWYWKCNGSSW